MSLLDGWAEACGGAVAAGGGAPAAGAVLLGTPRVGVAGGGVRGGILFKGDSISLGSSSYMGGFSGSYSILLTADGRR